jgi:hypothetical protein
MYVRTEILFPPDLIPQLHDAGGKDWQQLIDRIAKLDETDPERLALGLLMVRLCGCLECETDSFRAMRGCLACALQTVRRYRRQERELIKQYKATLKEVQEHLQETAPRQP